MVIWQVEIVFEWRFGLGGLAFDGVGVVVAGKKLFLGVGGDGEVERMKDGDGLTECRERRRSVVEAKREKECEYLVRRMLK